MSNQKITVTRGLVELKTLDARIKKQMRGAVFISYRCKKEEKSKTCVDTAKHQSITDLIEYRRKLKSAIVQSNAITEVNIDGNTFTVADVIERKNSVEYDRDLLKLMKTQLSTVTQQVEAYNVRTQSKLDSILEKSFGSSQKTNLDELQSFSESYLKANKAEIVDPIDLKVKIDRLEDSILKFDSEADLVLSESNAITFITVN